jgi:transposase
MSRRQKDPLRPLREEERDQLCRLCRGRCVPAAQALRARALLAVAEGRSYSEVAVLVGRHTGDTIRDWVSRFNREGMVAVTPQHGGGPPLRYGQQQRKRILAELQRTPDRERDGTATWSLTTLRNALRRTPDGLPQISTYTIWMTLQQAGVSWQKSRTWCQTGSAVRQRKNTVVTVKDIDAEPKKFDRAGLRFGRRGRCGGVVRRRGRAVSSGAPTRQQLATGMPSGDTAA